MLPPTEGMDLSHPILLAARLVADPNDSDALEQVREFGEEDPALEAQILENTGLSVPSGSGAAEWYLKAARIWRERLGDSREEQRLLRLACTSDPENPHFLRELSECLKREAELLTQRAHADPLARTRLGVILRELGRVCALSPHGEAFRRADDEEEGTVVMEGLGEEEDFREGLLTASQELAVMMRRACEQIADPDTKLALERQAQRIDEELARDVPLSPSTKQPEAIEPERLEGRLALASSVEERLDLAHQLADLYEQRGQISDAERVVRLVHELDPEDGRSLQRLCDLTDQRAQIAVPVLAMPSVVPHATVAPEVAPQNPRSARRSPFRLGKLELGGLALCVGLVGGGLVLARVSSARLPSTPAARLSTNEWNKPSKEATRPPLKQGLESAIAEPVAASNIQAEPVLATEAERRERVSAKKKLTVRGQPKAVVTLQRRAVDAAAAGNFEEARELYSQLAAHRPNDKVFAIASGILATKVGSSSRPAP